MQSNDLVAVKYTARFNRFVGNSIEIATTWKRKPYEKEDPKTGAKTLVPGIPLIAMSGPFTREEAQHFINQRGKENTTSPSVWEIVELCDIPKHTDVTENNMRK